jgi:uncharacterized protein YgbK (DUF1537 family)
VAKVGTSNQSSTISLKAAVLSFINILLTSRIAGLENTHTVLLSAILTLFRKVQNVSLVTTSSFDSNSRGGRKVSKYEN